MPETVIPDNVAYLYLGLVAFFGLLSTFLLSMVWRYRNLQRDLKVIEQLSDDS